MSAHRGDFDASTIVYGKFTTYRPSSGASFTLGGTPVLSVYKDASTTQSTSGVTLTVDFDAVTGLNHYAIDTSADGTFYSAGPFFDVVITTGTVDGINIAGSAVASFTIRKTSALRPTVAGRALDVSTGGEAGVDWANVGSPTTALALSATTISTAQVVASVTGAVGSVTGNVGGSVASVTGSVASVTGNVGGSVASVTGNVSGSVASVVGNVGGSVASVTGAVGSVTGAVGSVTGNVGGNVVGSVASVAGNVGGSVASVTGNVGGSVASVTGNVGGSVVGSVASVSGNVGGNVGGSVASVAAGGIAAASFATDAITSAAVAASAAIEIADTLLDRDMATGTDSGSSTVRTVRQALRFLRNKWSIVGTTLTVNKEDDTSSSWTATVSTTPGADPVTGNDPA